MAAQDWFEAELKQRIEIVDDYVHAYFDSLTLALPSSAPIQELKEAMFYSAGAGGKRFRPVLALIVGNSFGCASEKILPFAVAVELIHTYSLIHDDLPAMDNDDFRRGKPTNHKVYGETTALLAGDALLTEAFLLIAEGYRDRGVLASQLTALLSHAAGLRGMVGGQAIDLKAKDFTVQELTQLHELKTGRMIQVAAEGAAIIAGATVNQVQNFAEFGRNLGLAFQIADDILDQDDKDQGPRSFVTLLGLDGTKKFLNDISNRALEVLKSLPLNTPVLEQMVKFNQHRQS